MELRFKSHFYELMRAGCLGNTLRNWNTVEEALASSCELFGIREMGVWGGGGGHGIRSRAELQPYTRGLESRGIRYIVDEAAPDSDAQLQGEVCRSVISPGATCGWVGMVGVRTGRRMRDSMAEGLLRPRSGLTLRLLLDYFLDPSSRDDFEAIWDLYPNAVIEFTSYPYCLGKIPGRNTIIWEVRDY